MRPKSSGIRGLQGSDAIIEHSPRRRQGLVVPAESLAGEEMAGQAQAVAPVSRGSLRVGTEEETGEAEQAVAPDPGGVLRHRPAGARRDIGKALYRAADGAGGEVEAIAQLGQKRRLPPHQLG